MKTQLTFKENSYHIVDGESKLDIKPIYKNGEETGYWLKYIEPNPLDRKPTAKWQLCDHSNTRSYRTNGTDEITLELMVEVIKVINS